MRILLPVIAGSMLVSLAACTASPTASAPVTTTQNQVATTPVTSSTTDTTTTSTATAPAGPFTVDLTIQQDGLGLLAVTNSGKTKQTVDGWPTPTFLNAANETMAVPVHKVNIPGAAGSITLAPGQSAFAGVKWTDGDKASASTFVATTVQVTPPGAKAPVVANVIGTDGKRQSYYEFDITSVQVGTLQPSTQGVLVF